MSKDDISERVVSGSMYFCSPVLPSLVINHNSRQVVLLVLVSFLAVNGLVLDIVWLVAPATNLQTFGYWCTLLGWLLGGDTSKSVHLPFRSEAQPS